MHSAAHLAGVLFSRTWGEKKTWQALCGQIMNIKFSPFSPFQWNKPAESVSHISMWLWCCTLRARAGMCVGVQLSSSGQNILHTSCFVEMGLFFQMLPVYFDTNTGHTTHFMFSSNSRQHFQHWHSKLKQGRHKPGILLLSYVVVNLRIQGNKWACPDRKECLCGSTAERCPPLDPLFCCVVTTYRYLTST